MNPQKYPTLELAPQGEHVLLVRLNRPEVLNALNTQMGRDQLDLWTRITAEPGELRCVVLTGAGDRAFCAGGDLKERDGMTPAQWQAQHELFERAFVALVECPVPVIAAVNGHAFGGGLEIALCCDFIYAVPNARFAQSETRLGIMPGGMGTQNLPRAVGERRAKELILSARPFSAAEAEKWGLLNRICEAARLLDEALATAQEIGERAALHAAGEESHPLRPANGSPHRLPLRDRGLQPAGGYRRPARGRESFQREAQAGLQGPLSAAR